jgi:hypothetical protein
MFLKKLLRKKEPIIIVSGLPRSGTSMMMNMLRTGGLELATDGIRTADTDNPKGYYELEKVKELNKDTDKSWLKSKRGQVIKIISYLLKYLPDNNYYQIIFMQRNLKEVMASQNKMLERRGKQVNIEQDDNMIELYEKHISEVKSIIEKSDNMSVLYINHRFIIDEPQKAAEKVSRFLKKKLDIKAMSQIVEPKLHRNKSDV